MAHGQAYTDNTVLVYNRLTDFDSKFSSGIGNWKIVSGAGSLSVEYELKPYAGDTEYNTLKITPSNTDPITISTNEITTAFSDSQDNIAFHAKVLCSKPISVKLDMIEIGSTLANTSRTTSIAAERWEVVRSTGIDIPLTSGSFQIDTEITFSSHDGEPIYIAYPTVYGEYQFTENRFVREVVTLLPEIIRQKDYEQTYPKFPLLRLVEIGSSYAFDAQDEMEHFRFLSIAEGRDSNNVNTLSGLIDPRSAHEEFLPWLSQIVGIKLLGASSGTTAWESFLSTWSELMQAVDEAGFTTSTISTISRGSDGYVTITTDSGDWPSPVPEVEETIIVSGTTSFDGQYEITGVSTGSYQVTYNDGVKFGRLERASGEVTATIVKDAGNGYDGNMPDWAEVGTSITVTGTNGFNGSFAITEISKSANTITWTHAGSDTTETDGYGSYVTSESTGTFAQADTSWIELELSSITVSALINFYRSQILNAYNGFRAGSITALEAAAKEFLRETKTVQITRHYGGDIWSINVKTLTAETPDGITGESADIVNAVVQSASPAGYVVTHECVDSL